MAYDPGINIPYRLGYQRIFHFIMDDLSQPIRYSDETGAQYNRNETNNK